MGINIGSIFSQILCPFFVDMFGWWAGFLAAGGMLVGYALIQFDGGRLDGYRRAARAQPAIATLLI